MTGAVSDGTEVTVAREGDVEVVLHLRELRGSRSYKEIAELTGLRADEVSKIENGRTRAIAWATLARLARGLQVSLGQLVEVRRPSAPVDALTADVLAALADGHIDERTQSTQVRGHDRRYDDLDSGWAGTRPDPSTELKHRRTRSSV